MVAVWVPSVTVSAPPVWLLFSEKASVVVAPKPMLGRSMPSRAARPATVPVKVP
jgi:hypothetical protein